MNQGDKIVLAAFGSGFTWGGSIIMIVFGNDNSYHRSFSNKQRYSYKAIQKLREKLNFEGFHALGFNDSLITGLENSNKTSKI